MGYAVQLEGPNVRLGREGFCGKLEVKEESGGKGKLRFVEVENVGKEGEDCESKISCVYEEKAETVAEEIRSDGCLLFLC